MLSGRSRLHPPLLCGDQMFCGTKASQRGRLLIMMSQIHKWGDDHNLGRETHRKVYVPLDTSWQHTRARASVTRMDACDPSNAKMRTSSTLSKSPGAFRPSGALHFNSRKRCPASRTAWATETGMEPIAFEAQHAHTRPLDVMPIQRMVPEHERSAKSRL